MIPDSVNKHAQGWFAKTTNQVGSITFDTIPIIEVSGEQAVPIVGQEVHRVGQKTGWRKGPVVQTGVDQPNWDGSIVWVYDTDVATMTRDEGDSGAPVIVRTILPGGGVGSTWKIAGMHIGGMNNSAVFSAMWNIEQDMGGLATTGIPRGVE